MPVNVLEGLPKFEGNFPLRERIDLLIREWKLMYPRLNIEKQIRAAHLWLLENPKRDKANYARFLGNWMRTAQQWAESSPVYTEPIKPVVPLPAAPDVTQEDLDEMHRQTVKALGPKMCKDPKCEVCGK